MLGTSHINLLLFLGLGLVALMMLGSLRGIYTPHVLPLLFRWRHKPNDSDLRG